MFHFHTPWKFQKRMFSGSIETKCLSEMSLWKVRLRYQNTLCSAKQIWFNKPSTIATITQWEKEANFVITEAIDYLFSTCLRLFDDFCIRQKIRSEKIPGLRACLCQFYLFIFFFDFLYFFWALPTQQTFQRRFNVIFRLI